MFWKKLGTIAATFVVLAVCGVGLGWPGRGEQRDQPPDTPMKTEKARPATTEKARGTAGAQPPRTEKGPRPATPDRPPRDDSAEQRAIREQGEKAIEDIDTHVSRARVETRSQMIELEEKTRELEFRHNWQREQQKQGLQNLETDLRTQQQELRRAQAAIPKSEGELLKAKQMAKLVETGAAPTSAIAELQMAERNHDANVQAEMRIRPQMAKLEQEIAKLKIEGLKAEETRTAERIRMRREMVAAEERMAETEQKAARQRERVMAEVERLAPRPPAENESSRMHDLERKVEALQREVSELRRAIQRSPNKPE